MIEYGTNYFWFNGEDGRFYKLKPKVLNTDGNNIFDVVSVEHNGWRTNQGGIEPGPVIIYDGYEGVDTVLDYLIIKQMCTLGRVGPFFEHDIQIEFYKELFILLEKYPDQYMKYITETFDDELHQAFQRLSLYNTKEKEN